MLCHGSTQMKRIGFCGVDQISVYGKFSISTRMRRPVSRSSTQMDLDLRFTMQWLSRANSSALSGMRVTLRAR